MSKVLEPLGDRILAEQLDAAEKSEHGIIIPETSRQKPKEAIVLSVGPGRRLETGEIIPMQVEVGDHVIFASFAGQEVEVDGKPFLLLSQDEILARVKS
jgi:chaperonin GroES